MELSPANRVKVASNSRGERKLVVLHDAAVNNAADVFEGVFVRVGTHGLRGRAATGPFDAARPGDEKIAIVRTGCRSRRWRWRWRRRRRGGVVSEEDDDRLPAN